MVDVRAFRVGRAFTGHDWSANVSVARQHVKSADTEEGRERINHTLRLTITSDAPLRPK